MSIPFVCSLAGGKWSLFTSLLVIYCAKITIIIVILIKVSEGLHQGLFGVFFLQSATDGDEKK